MRIGIVTYDFYPPKGGQGRHTYELWRHLREFPDVDVRVFSPAVNDLPGHIRSGRVAARAGSPAFSIVPSLALDRWREAHGIDLFHLNGGPGGVLLYAKPRAPYVYTAHHTYAQQARLVPGQGWKRVLKLIEARSYRGALGVAADTASTAHSVISELGVPAGKVRVIPSGVNCEEFRPREVPRLKDSVLFVGRLDARKGLPFLLEAWTHVIAARPSARLYVIGVGPLRARAEGQIRVGGLGGTVAFLGRVDHERLVTWYNQVNCVAVPSRFEGFGLVAVEALACGTPVVATDSEGLRDVVEGGLEARLAPQGDARSFGDALLEVLGRARKLSMRRVAEVRARYDWQRIAGHYRDFYVSPAGALVAGELLAKAAA